MRNILNILSNTLHELLDDYNFLLTHRKNEKKIVKSKHFEQEIELLFLSLKVLVGVITNFVVLCAWV